MSEPHSPLPTALVMPANVRGGQVISLVEITGGIGGKVDASKLADELGADIAVLLPILEAAEMLGLVKSEKGGVYLTDLGLKFQKKERNKLTMLKDKISMIEPFKTALQLAAKGRPFTAGDVAEELTQIGLKWHYQPDINEQLINTLLIHWAIYAGLLKYDGKSMKFQRA